MYERSAIVLEKYLNKIFGPDKESDIRVSYETFKNVLEEMEKYQVITEEEEKIIDEFDDIVNKMQKIQKEQEGLSKEITKHEDIRTKLFNDFDQEPAIIEKKLIKIENIIEERAQKEQELRESYIELLNEFTEKQTERNKCNKMKRTSETNHIKILNGAVETLGTMDIANVKKIKEFITTDDELLCDSLNKIMLENGKNEKVKFDKDVMKKAVEVRIKMAKKEAECYVTSYERLKRLMAEIDNDNLNLSRYQKNLKDITAKLKFLEIEKEYLVSFLDNERITAISGEKAHKIMMEQACKDFDGDMVQIHNLYNLLTREITGKSTKKAYKELYNKDYFRKIEEGSLQIEDEASKLGLNIAMVINSNYWRVEGIREIYTAFYQIITEIYGKELEEFETAEEETAKEQTSNIEETVELELPQAKTIESIAEEDDEIEEEEEKQNIQNAQIVEETAKEKVKINNIEISNTNEDTEEFEEDEEDEFADIESQIAELEDDFENEEYDSIKDIPYEDEKIDDFDAEESLFAPIIKAKETGEDLKAALQAVKEGPSKKKKSNIFKNLIKMNTKGKKVEG